MAGIVLSTAVRDNLLSLQNTASLLSTTQNKLSTGLRINSALDDPAAFFTAQGLNNRASDLNKLLDNTGLAVQTLKAADQSLKSLTKLVEQAKSTVTQARNTKVKATSVTANGANTLAGSDAVTALAVGVSTGSQLIIERAGQPNTTIAAASLSVDQLVTEIASEADITAIREANGDIKITQTGGQDITFSGALATRLGIDQTYSNGVNRNQFEQDYNNLLGQIDQLSSDSGYNGVNLFSGDNLTVVFNEDGSSTLDITGVTYDAAGLLLEQVNDRDFGDEANVTDTLSSLDTAISTLRGQATTFGNNLAVVQNRQTFTKNLISTLESGASGLTLADTNQEAANLLALQTRQSLGSTALSLANQAEQAVLRLFR